MRSSRPREQWRGLGRGREGAVLSPESRSRQGSAHSAAVPGTILRTRGLLTAELTVPTSQMKVRTRGSQVTEGAGEVNGAERGAQLCGLRQLCMRPRATKPCAKATGRRAPWGVYLKRTEAAGGPGLSRCSLRGSDPRVTAPTEILAAGMCVAG